MFTLLLLCILCGVVSFFIGAHIALYMVKTEIKISGIFTIGTKIYKAEEVIL